MKDGTSDFLLVLCLLFIFVLLSYINHWLFFLGFGIGGLFSCILEEIRK